MEEHHTPHPATTPYVIPRLDRGIQDELAVNNPFGQQPIFEFRGTTLQIAK